MICGVERICYGGHGRTNYDQISLNMNTVPHFAKVVGILSIWDGGVCMGCRQDACNRVLPGFDCFRTPFRAFQKADFARRSTLTRSANACPFSGILRGPSVEPRSIGGAGAASFFRCPNNDCSSHAASPAHANRTAAEIADLANNNNEMK